MYNLYKAIDDSSLLMPCDSIYYIITHYTASNAQIEFLKNRAAEVLMVAIQSSIRIKELESTFVQMDDGDLEDHGNGLTIREALVEYAKDCIKGRWPELEPLIVNYNAHYAFAYAKHVIKARWPEAEPMIARNKYTAFHYNNTFHTNL